MQDDIYVEKSTINVNLLGTGEDVETFWKCIPPSYRQGTFPSIV